MKGIKKSTAVPLHKQHKHDAANRHNMASRLEGVVKNRGIKPDRKPAKNK